MQYQCIIPIFINQLQLVHLNCTVLQTLLMIIIYHNDILIAPTIRYAYLYANSASFHQTNQSQSQSQCHLMFLRTNHHSVSHSIGILFFPISNAVNDFFSNTLVFLLRRRMAAILPNR